MYDDCENKVFNRSLVEIIINNEGYYYKTLKELQL